MGIALAAVEPHANPSAVLWGLLALLQREGLNCQAFASQARFTAADGALAVTGRPLRYLDGRLMSRRRCQQLFSAGLAGADAAVVFGQLAAGERSYGIGSRETPPLAALCQWLNLAPLVVLPSTSVGGCRLPARPDRVSGVILDGIEDSRQMARATVAVEAAWNAPVVAALPPLPAVRAVIEKLRPGDRVSAAVCRQLGRALAARVRGDRWQNLLEQARVTGATTAAELCHGRFFGEGGPRVAVAFDEAVCEYYPSALELLEERGARIVTFSPLRDESLPEQADVLMLGGGPVERFARALASNACLMHDIRRFAEQGGRVLAEGGGLAYLSQRMIDGGGRSIPMCGVLPLTARRRGAQGDETPLARLPLKASCWIGRRGQTLRGYFDSQWALDSIGQVKRCAVAPDGEVAVLARRNVVGSRMRLFPAANPQLLNCMLRRLPTYAAT